LADFYLKKLNRDAAQVDAITLADFQIRISLLHNEELQGLLGWE
jgi:hypothetical protein